MLSKRQKEIYDFINNFINVHDYAPSLEEIGNHFGLSAVSTVHHHVQQLIGKGYLKNRFQSNRSLEIISSSPSPVAICVPLVGTIAAGEPIEAIEQEETIELPPSLAGRGDTYVLKVQGNSMIDEHIRDGDYVVVDPRDSADNGETVVALLNGSEATLKKFYREKGGRIRLQPANPIMAPIYCNADNVTIRGVVIAILRKF